MPQCPHPSLFTYLDTTPTTSSSPSSSFFFCPTPHLTLNQILKLYAWELSFQTQVEDIRGQELRVMKKFAYLSSVSTFVFSCAPALVSDAKEPHKKRRSRKVQEALHFLMLFVCLQVSLATFAVFVGVSPDNVLSAEKAFTSISLFNILRFPLAMLPMLIAAIVQVRQQKHTLHAGISKL